MAPAASATGESKIAKAKSDKVGSTPNDTLSSRVALPINTSSTCNTQNDEHIGSKKNSTRMWKAT